jgi:hypothetical protein
VDTETRFCEKCNADICLYRWFWQRNREIVLINGATLKAQALQFNKLVDGDQIFKSFGGWL